MCTLASKIALRDKMLRTLRTNIQTRWKRYEGAVLLSIGRLVSDSSPDCEDAFVIWAKTNHVDYDDPDYKEFRKSIEELLPASRLAKISMLTDLLEQN